MTDEQYQHILEELAAIRATLAQLKQAQNRPTASPGSPKPCSNSETNTSENYNHPIIFGVFEDSTVKWYSRSDQEMLYWNLCRPMKKNEAKLG